MIAIGSDHGGYKLKKEIMEYLKKENIDFKDFGTNTEESVNYPVFATLVSKAVQSKECKQGILICLSGVGMSIVANKFKGIRCALVHNEHTAEYSRLHNNSNVIAIGAKDVTSQEAIKLINIYLNTEFEGERHKIRLDLINDIENTNMK